MQILKRHLNYIKILSVLITGSVFYFAPVETKNNMETEVIEYKTEYIYRDNIPNNVSKVITEGINGIVNIEKDTNDYTIIQKAINEVVEVGTAPVGEYVGTLTGYGPDCAGCSGKVYCKNREGSWQNLRNNGITYEDTEYGEVRILAADTTLFPCGTIIEFSNNKFEPTIGIVLDTGATMKHSWRKHHKVAIDLAFSSEKVTSNVTNKNTTYTVKRWGW